MQYRTMKKTGDSLSALGFGCMRLPKKGRTIDEERATKQIRYAIDHGVNYLDTAYSYKQEAIIGRVLAGGYREKVKLATKMPLYLVSKTEDLDQLLDESLRNLQTDHIDYYLFHALSVSAWDRLKGLGVTDFIARAKADGRIRHIGFSSHNGTMEFKQLVDAYDWDFCQISTTSWTRRTRRAKKG